MPFLLNPLFLFGLMAAGIPIAIHLLNQRNPKPFRFSTLRFIEAALIKTRRTRHLTQLLVLLARILILALLALAFAQPRLSSSTWLPEGPRTIVVVLDATASMRTRGFEAAAFERAREWALDTLTGLRDRDRAALVVPGLDAPYVVFPAISNRSRLQKAVSDLSCGYGTAALSLDLKEVLRRVWEEHPADPVEVHVFSDFQATNWSAEDIAGLGSEIKARETRLFLNRIQTRPASNAAIASLQTFPEAILGAGHVTVEAVVRNNPDCAGANLLTLTVNGAEAARKGFQLEAGGEKRQSVTATVEAGEAFALLTARLDVDALDADNARHAVITHRDSVRVLVVDGGSTTGGDAFSDSFYVTRALNPKALPTPLIVGEIVSWQVLPSLELGQYGAVVLCNPPPMDPGLVLRLESYAADGGSLLLYPGHRRGIRDSHKLFKSMAGIDIEKEKYLSAKTFRLRQSVRAHPLEHLGRRLFEELPSFAGKERLLLKARDGALEALFHMDSGTPALLHIPWRRGEIWLSALAADRTWSEWPLSPLFVIFHQEAVRRSLADSARTAQTNVGALVEVPWSGSEELLNIRVTAPNGIGRGDALQRANTSQSFLLGGFDEPGHYRVDILTSPAETRYVAVNVPAAESNLDATPTDILGGPAPASVYQPVSVAEHREMLSTVHQGVPLWPWLLLLAFVIGIAEECFANVRSWRQGVPSTLETALKRARVSAPS